MPKSAFEPCIPTRGTTVPTGPEWIHEIKHDGYRLIVQRDGKRVRLLTRNGHDWSDRFPLITEAALRNRNSSFVIDGEAVLLGVDGRSDFNGLHSRKHDDEVEFYAFDILVSDGEDLRKLPLQHAQDQPGPAAGAARRRHLPVRLRTGRDRPGPVPPRLPDGAGGAGLEAPRERPIAPAGRRTGSRSRTGSIRRSAACRISSSLSRSALATHTKGATRLRAVRAASRWREPRRGSHKTPAASRRSVAPLGRHSGLWDSVLKNNVL